jgi:hypothetical protein
MTPTDGDDGTDTNDRGAEMTQSGARPTPGRTFEAEMDELSLRQALMDFEVANARVLDLTQRLVEAQAVITQLRTELESLRIEHSQLASLHERMKTSRAFRSAEKLWALRNAIGI